LRGAAKLPRARQFAQRQQIRHHLPRKAAHQQESVAAAVEIEPREIRARIRGKDDWPARRAALFRSMEQRLGRRFVLFDPGIDFLERILERNAFSACEARARLVQLAAHEFDLRPAFSHRLGAERFDALRPAGLHFRARPGFEVFGNVTVIVSIYAWRCPLSIPFPYLNRAG
jgi:hypothetical protein